jgi:hypothetical protein
MYFELRPASVREGGGRDSMTVTKAGRTQRSGEAGEPSLDDHLTSVHPRVTTHDLEIK